MVGRAAPRSGQGARVAVRLRREGRALGPRDHRRGHRRASAGRLRRPRDLRADLRRGVRRESAWGRAVVRGALSRHATLGVVWGSESSMLALLVAGSLIGPVGDPTDESVLYDQPVTGPDSIEATEPEPEPELPPEPEPEPEPVVEPPPPEPAPQIDPPPTLTAPALALPPPPPPPTGA